MHRQHVRLLYKSILRLHRGLPKELQELGDDYVKSEFRRHKDVSPEHVAPFMMEWASYCTTLAKQIDPKTRSKLGMKIEIDKLEETFQNQQIYQLYELKRSIDSDEGEHITHIADSNSDKGKS